MALRLLCCSSRPSTAAAPRLYHRESLQHLQSLRTLVSTVSAATTSPVESLRRGNWVKLICGASFEDVVDVRNLSLVYALAGVDCIDCAADDSVVNAVNEGIEAACSIAHIRRPWVMVSVNDDKEDLHFRKAEFDPEDCPPDCWRPCQSVCPADAISLERVEQRGLSTETASLGKLQGGIIKDRCYGCGRCIPVCPYDKISAVTYIRDADSISLLLKRDDVDAIEIHTTGRSHDLFSELWSSVGNSIQNVRLVAISLPNMGESTVPAMQKMYSTMVANLPCYNLWQLDGRPMSGDVGRGATREVIKFASYMASAMERPSGFLQLAGGTNSHTISYLKKLGLFQSSRSGCPHSVIGGVAYGGYARKIVGRVLRKLPVQQGWSCIEQYPEHLLEALGEAVQLVGQVKCYEPHA